MSEQSLATVEEEIDETEPGDAHRCYLRTADHTSPESSKSHREELLEALRREDPVKSRAVIEGGKENAKTLQTLNDECRAVAQRQEDCLCSSIKKISKRILACIKSCFCKAPDCWGCCSQCCTDEQQLTEDQIEEEKQWIEILSNPLYISLEWLWRIQSKSNPTQTATPSDTPNGVASPGAKDENQDVIATALRDSHLLEMIAGNDLHQHKDEYQERANEIEEFAIAVVEGSTRDQLIDIMDTKGEGCLKKQKPTNFSQSLNLMKIAAYEKREKVGEFPFVTAPRGKVF